MTWSYIALTASIVDHHSLSIDHYQQFTVDAAKYEGRFYSGVPPGLSMLSVPAYALLSYGLDLKLNKETQPFICFFCALFSSSLAGALSVVLLLRIGDRFSSNEDQNRLIALAFAFGTSMLVYGSVMLSRIVVVLLLLSAYWLLLRIRENRNSPRSAFLVGMLCAAGVLFDYLTIIFIPAFIVYIYVATKRASTCAWFLMGSLPPLLFLAVYHHAVFGGVFETPYAHRAGRTQKGYHAGGIAGITYPGMDSLFSILFSYGNSLFIYMPVLIISLYSIFINFLRKKYIKEIVFICFYLLLIVSSFLLTKDSTCQVLGTDSFCR